MSAIAGILRFDGRPVERRDLERMAYTLDAHGPDRRGFLVLGEIGFAHLLMRMTPEDASDRQPLRAQSGAVMTADLRLDNREDIASALGFDRDRAAAASDAMLVLAAWERWGDACWARLRGPFAVAIWEPRRRVLTLARDPLGLAPMTWHRGPGFFAFATLPKGLLALPDVPRALNEEKFADFLVLNHAEHETTLYREIFRLPPAHLARIDPAGRMTSDRYWSADDIKPVRLASDEAYADALREHLDRAVRRQLRSIHPVGCFLSGGLDSSSVAALAARALAEQGRRLAAYTQVPREGFEAPPGMPGYADETPFVEEISRALGNIDLTLVRNSDCDDFAGLERVFHAAGVPVRNVINLGWGLEIMRLARSRHQRVLLGGGFGNITISWDGWPQALAGLTHGRLLRAYRVWRLLYRLSTKSRHGALRFLFLQPLGIDAQSLLKRIRGSRTGLWREHAAIRPEFAAQMKVDERARRAGHDFLYRNLGSTVEQRMRMLTGSDEIGDWHAGIKALHGIELRDPTGDLDVVSFCLGVPDEQYLVEDVFRSLVRRAMWGTVPASVLTNCANGVQSADWFEKLAAHRETMLSEIAELRRSPLACRALDLDRLERSVRDWPSGRWYHHRVRTEYQVALPVGLASGRYLRWFEQRN